MEHILPIDHRRHGGEGLGLWKGWCFSFGVLIVWRQAHGSDAATANDTGSIRMRRLKLLCRKGWLRGSLNPKALYTRRTLTGIGKWLDVGVSCGWWEKQEEIRVGRSGSIKVLTSDILSSW